jgi:DNA helicase II / ATP-dependent DNA helicase PcrA
VLARNDYRTVQSFLEKKGSSFDCLRICARDLSFDLGGKAFPARGTARSFILAKKAVEAAAKAGYFCYDEMFVWARSLLEDFPNVAPWLRRRFPLVILDEMQDTSDLQGRMLHAIFPRSSPEIVVQRVGDPNQAIFNDSDAKPNESDPFPDTDPTCNLGIPNSYRFGPTIATLASPFAITPVGTFGLCGIGPKPIIGAPTVCRHAIFIFPDDSTNGVLDAYGKYVLETFADDALTIGKITAVGAVHQDERKIGPGHPQFPKSVPHYWSGYTAEISRKEPHPKTFVQYIRAAHAVIRDGWDLSPGVEKLASGLVRLAGIIGDTGQIKRKARTHRTIVETLEATPITLGVYRQLIKTLLIDWLPLTEENWIGVRANILAIACALCEGNTKEANATDFLTWPGKDPPLAVCTPTSQAGAGPNVYRVSDGGRCVDIRLGSIHSVKGQNHLATLVLNTYWYAHSSQRILPWLLGEKVNGDSAGIQDRKRLLQTYVAMTRPSHMVCFAVRRSAFGDVKAYARHIATLSDRGWRVAEIIEGTLKWHI